jgi:hypothetical protein
MILVKGDNAACVRHGIDPQLQVIGKGDSVVGDYEWIAKDNDASGAVRIINKKSAAMVL